jgi:hypothetical protein
MVLTEVVTEEPPRHMLPVRVTFRRVTEWLIWGLFGERLLFRKQDFKGVLQTCGSEPLAEGRG